MKFIDLNKKAWQWALFFALAFIWGSSFILMKKGLQSYSNYQVAAFRLFFTFLFFLPFIFKHIKKLSKSNLKSILITGFLGSGFPAFLFTTAQTQISSSFSGILNSLTPIFTLIVGVMFYKAKSRWLNAVGLLIGLAGATGLIYKDAHSFLSGNHWYSLFVVLATLFYGINVNEVKFKLGDLSGITISTLSFLFTGPLCGIYLLFSDFSHAVETPHYLLNLSYIMVLAFFSSFIGVIGINVLIKHVSPVVAASTTYVIPVFAVMWGMLDGETISIIDILWILLIFAGVYLVNKKSNKLVV